MKTANHEFTVDHFRLKNRTVPGMDTGEAKPQKLTVTLHIFTMDSVEADVYEQPDARYRIEGFVDGNPAGIVYSTGNLGSCYWGEDTLDAARAILAKWTNTQIIVSKV